MGDVQIREWGAPGDLGWVLKSHGELYAAEYGFDHSFEQSVSRTIAGFAQADPARRRGWIAELDGRRIGSIACSPSDIGEDEVAQLRLLLLHPDARGIGLGGRLVDTCLAFARETGFRRIRLFTVDVLTAARALYERRGFTLTHQAPHAGFGPPVIGMVYERDLAGSPG